MINKLQSGWSDSRMKIFGSKLRQEVCEQPYGNLGLLMDLHRQNRPAIADCFDLQTLREAVRRKPVQPTNPPAPASPTS
jgi:hypothetical protein